MAVKERLAELGLDLPPPMHLSGQRFELIRIAGDQITIAGHLPIGPDGSIAGPLGKVGAEVSADEAYQSARLIALAMMASLDAAGIDLDRVEWRKVFGMVNAAPGFNALPGVINGFSDILLEVFGDRGRHSRSAIGVAELPFGAPVEVEAAVSLLPADPTPRTEAAALVRPAEAKPVSARLSHDDPGLRSEDYAGIQPLSIPAEALIRSIDSLSNLFWISIAGTVVTIFLAALVNLEGSASGSVQFGEYRIPSGVLPIACLAFAMFLFWLTASRLRMLETALGDDDLTAGMARDIFRLDPPVLDVFDAANLRPFAMLSGVSVLLWVWSFFLGSSLGLIFSATIIHGAAASVDEFPSFLAYAGFTFGVMVYGAVQLNRPLRRILQRLHGARLRIGAARMVVAALVVGGGILTTNPDLASIWLSDTWRAVGPIQANAIDGETLLLEHGEVVKLVGIEALRPDQTCSDADGVIYPCGHQATVHLQSLVQQNAVGCVVSYPNLGLCVPLEAGELPPTQLQDYFVERSFAAQMVSAGLALAEGDGTELLVGLQNEAQRNRVGAWQGAFDPPSQWAATRPARAL